MNRQKAILIVKNNWPENPNILGEEKIRKWIVRTLKSLNNSSIQIDGAYEMMLPAIAWLEKQGEQKPAIFIPKFRVGDKLVSTKNPSLTYEVLEVGHISELGNPEYKVEIFTDGKVKNPRNIHYMECRKVDEWAKLIEHNHALSEEDKNMLEAIIDNYEYMARKLRKGDGSDGVEDDLEVIDWLKNLKNRVQPKQKWSEEDEKIRKEIISAINIYCSEYSRGSKARNDMLAWLEKQGEQKSAEWRPSREQIIALRWVLNNIPYNKHKEEISGLLDQIKEL